MKKLFLLIIFICNFMTVAVAQHQKSNQSRILINKSKPAVFITFLYSKEIKPDNPDAEKNNIFFKITNNTRWNIWLQMSGVSKKDYGDASLYYEIRDEEKHTSFGSLYCHHICSSNPVRSGRSIIFSIPASEASYDAVMQLLYSFDWELESENVGSNHSTHIMAFDFVNLPKSIFRPTRQ